MRTGLWKFRVLIALALVGGLLGYGLRPQEAQAVTADEWFDSRVACWSSGDFSDNVGGGNEVGVGENAWGRPDGFVVDTRDLGASLGLDFRKGGLTFVPDSPIGDSYLDGYWVRTGGLLSEAAHFSATQGVKGALDGLLKKDGVPFTGTFGSDLYFAGVAYNGLVQAGGAVRTYVDGVDVTAQIQAGAKSVWGKITGLGQRQVQEARDVFGNVKGFFGQSPRDISEFSEVYEAGPGDSAPGTAGLESRTVALFESFPEAIDYTFFADVRQGGSSVAPLRPDGRGNLGSASRQPDRDLDDLRMNQLDGLVGSLSDPYPSVANGRLLPWGTSGEYLDRRKVAKIAPGRIKKYSAAWINPDNPSGAQRVSHFQRLQDKTSAEADLAVASRRTAGGGHRILTGVEYYAALELLSTTTLNCQGTSCTQTSQVDTTPVEVQGHSTGIDVNSQESFDVTLVDARRPVAIKQPDGIVDGIAYKDVLAGEALRDGSAAYRDEAKAGYGELFIFDSEADEIQVVLELEGQFRRDYEFPAGDYLEFLYLPALGVEEHVWTYDLIGMGRWAWLNDSHQDGLPTGDSTHMGYRQPALSRAYFGGEPNFTPDGTRHVRWPTNLEDLAWYLYQLPGAGPADATWRLWLSEYGRQGLVFGGYAQNNNGVELPDCQVQRIDASDEELFDAAGVPLSVDHFIERPLLASKNLECRLAGLPTDYFLNKALVTPWQASQLALGQASGVFFPFDVDAPLVAPYFPLLAPGPVNFGGGVSDQFELVKAGIASPVDADEAVGQRELTRFAFVVREGHKFGSGDIRAEGSKVLKQYGVPRDEGLSQDYLEGWPNASIDPNRPYLMVVAFYESLSPIEFGIAANYRQFQVLGGGSGSGGAIDDGFRLPKRYIRRVVCRMMVLPPGFSSEAEEQTSIMAKLADGLLDGLTKDFQRLASWISSILRSVGTAHFSVVENVSEFACVGLLKVDQLTALENVSGKVIQTRVASSGALVVNEAAKSRNDGIDACKRVTVPVVPACQDSVDVVASETCVGLPRMEIRATRADFVSLEGMVDGKPYREYGDGGRSVAPGTVGGDLLFVDAAAGHLEDDLLHADPVFLPAVLSDSPDPITSKNVGLTRVHLEWDFEAPGVPRDVYDSVDGFVVYVTPDEKSRPRGFGETLRFMLPRWVVEYVSGGAYVDRHRMEKITFGGLGVYPDNRMGSNALVYFSNYSGGRAYDGRELDGGAFSTPSFAVLGGDDVENDFRGFLRIVENMPLAPGFVHAFEVAPYSGHPGSSDFREGPKSEKIVLDGNKAFCEVPFEGLGLDYRHLREIYACPDPNVRADLGYFDEGFRVGLLSITGSDICRDIFSTTPPVFTWDNPIVQRVWAFVLIIGGAVLFSLLVWQGLRMTYDVWLDPQPTVGFRELVPRFLLSIALMAGSLVLCRLALVVASDLTCFVAQMTGMSMWGVVGNTYGTIVDGYLNWAEGLFDFAMSAPFPVLLLSFAAWLVGGLVVIILLIAVLYMFIKVGLGMLLRIALLAVLIALSPLAFAFYASDTTSHWTKRWVSMFLGATFQQVIVLIVLYLGGHMLGNYFDSTNETTLGVLIIGLLVSVVVLALADRVPAIINPAGQGMFQSLGQLGQMAVAGGIMAVTAGTGLVAGAAWGGIEGFGRGWSGGEGGSGVPGPGGGPGGRGGGGFRMGMPAGGGAETPAQLQAGEVPGQSRAEGHMAGLRGTSFASPGSGVQGAQTVEPGPSVRAGVAGRGSGGGDAEYDAYQAVPEAPSGGVGAGPSRARQFQRGAGQFASNFARGLAGVPVGMASGGYSGLRRGSRFGSGVNTRMADVTSGNFLYRHSSRADDTAAMLERQQAARGEGTASGGPSGSGASGAGAPGSGPAAAGGDGGRSAAQRQADMRASMDRLASVMERVERRL